MTVLEDLTVQQRATDLRATVEFLTKQQSSKLDAIVPFTHLSFRKGVLQVADAPLLSRAGVTQIGGSYRVTELCLSDLATKLGIPIKVLRRWHTERPDVFDEVTNRLIHGAVEDDFAADPDNRSVTLRAFRSDDPTVPGIARGLLSDSYKIIDNLPVLSAVLHGARRTGLEVQIPEGGCNVSESRLTVDFWCPQVAELAPVLLGGYRTVFGGPEPVLRAGWSLERAREVAAREGQGFEAGQEPIVFAGFRVENSELGRGAFKITPRLVVEVCRNGLQLTQDVFSAMHLGSRQEAGIIDWSAETRANELEVMTSRTADVVGTFLSGEYLSKAVAAIEAKAGKRVEDATETVKAVTSALGFDEDVFTLTLEHFLAGGQRTSGGLLNAWTSVAQCVDDAEEAADMEAKALRILDLV